MSFNAIASLMLPVTPVSVGTMPAVPFQSAPTPSDREVQTATVPAPAADAVLVPDASSTSAEDQTDIVVQARRRTRGDPLQTVNAKAFAVTQRVDEAFIGPAALAYERTLPRPVRSGLRNFLNNLHEPNVFLNYLVQIKPGKAGETLGRFALNSTIGVAGLFDVAKRRPFNLPRRANGFADTLGFYGVKPGPFLFLPLFGATTVRDLFGTGVDQLASPLSLVGKPFNQTGYRVSRAAFSTLDHRAEFDEQLIKIRDSADPYAARRQFYLEGRQAEIDGLHGSHHRAGNPDPATRPIGSVTPLSKS